MATARPRHNRRHNGSLVSEQDRLARKREQNRIAQQVYRRAQKERIQALEAAVAKSSSVAGGGTWAHSEDGAGANLLFIDGPAVTASGSSATSVADSSNFNSTLFQPLLDSNLDPSLTHSLSNGHGGGSGDAFSDYMRQGSHRTTTTIAAAAATTTTSSLSFDHYGHQNYDVESAPALTFSSTQADDISIPVTSPASNGAAATASAVDVAEEAAAWNHLMDSHMMDTAGGESCDRARREPSSMSPADSTVQYRHEHYSPTPPSTMLARHRNRSTSLHIAASQGDSEMVKLLLNRGANAGLLNEDGQTPLHLAVIALAKAAKRLSGGCSSNVDDDSGGGGGSGQAKEAEKTLQLLLGARSAGADPRALDNSGRSVLFTAVATGSEGAVQMVLDSMGCESSLAGSSSSSSRSSSSSSSGANKGIGADVGRAGIQAALDEPDAQGTLPLHLAVASRSASMVLLLLSNGADIDG